MKERELDDIFEVDDLNKEHVYYKSIRGKIMSTAQYNIDEIVPEVLDDAAIKESIAMLENHILGFRNVSNENITSQKKIQTVEL